MISLRREVLRNGIVGVVCVIILAVAWKAASDAKRDLALQKQRQHEINELAAEFSAYKEKLASVEGRQNLRQVAGVVQAVDEIIRPLGISEKVKSVKPVGVKDGREYTGEEAEVQIDKLTTNELVNLLYRTRNVPMQLSVTRTSVKQSFEKPDLLNLTMTVSLFKRKQ